MQAFATVVERFKPQVRPCGEWLVPHLKSDLLLYKDNKMKRKTNAQQARFLPSCRWFSFRRFARQGKYRLAHDSLYCCSCAARPKLHATTPPPCPKATWRIALVRGTYSVSVTCTMRRAQREDARVTVVTRYVNVIGRTKATKSEVAFLNPLQQYLCTITKHQPTVRILLLLHSALFIMKCCGV